MGPEAVGIPFGRILTSHLRGASAAFRVGAEEIPPFGSLVRVAIGNRGDGDIFGLVADIRMEEDGFLRQLASGAELDPEIILDSRENRNVPIVLTILFVGSRSDERVSHLLPPRPPLTLDELYVCGDAEVVEFCGEGRFGYFRHLLRGGDYPIEELVAAHFREAIRAHAAVFGSAEDWERRAVGEMMNLMNGDFDRLYDVFGALSDLDPAAGRERQGRK